MAFLFSLNEYLDVNPSYKQCSAFRIGLWNLFNEMLSMFLFGVVATLDVFNKINKLLHLFIKRSPYELTR